VLVSCGTGLKDHCLFLLPTCVTKPLDSALEKLASMTTVVEGVAASSTTLEMAYRKAIDIYNAIKGVTDEMYKAQYFTILDLLTNQPPLAVSDRG